MTTIGVPSGTLLHLQIGSLSVRSQIWTVNMNIPDFGPPPRTTALIATGRALRWLGHKMAECRRNHRGYQELAAMSDLELEDIGINRADIGAVFADKYDKARPNLPNITPQLPGKTRPYSRNHGDAGSRR